MGHGLSRVRDSSENDLFDAVRIGDAVTVRSLIERDGVDGGLVHTTRYDRQSALHIAAANGWIEIVCILLEHGVSPDLLNRNEQTPLMLAAIHGKVACVQKLLEAGANVLMFDSIYGRACLHYAAYYGHSECVQAIIAAAHPSPIAASWGVSCRDLLDL